MGCHNSKDTGIVTPSYHNPKSTDEDTTDHPEKVEAPGLFGLHKAKTIAEVKELEDSMGGNL